MNVFEFAMKMEDDAAAYYKKLAEESSSEGIRNIFLDLAADENKHYQIFQAMKAQAESAPATMEESTALDNARNAFEKMISERPSAEDIKGDLEAYEHAMKMEAEGARVYEEALAKEKNPEVKSLLERIIQEEFRHYNIIRNVYDFVNAPEEFLAWREFSNIEEFRNFGRDTGA